MSDLNDIEIGKIVKSNTHIDYICQIYNSAESTLPVKQTDYTFGTFVSIQVENVDTAVDSSTARLIGVIYNTLLLNPDFGNLGPRLSPRSEVEVFSPDYLSETATLVGIIMVGWCDDTGRYHQGVPALAASVNSFVNRLDEPALQEFHCDDTRQPCLRYAPILLAQRDPLVPQLLMAIIDRLNVLFPDSSSRLSVMRNNLAWKSIVQPAG